RARQSKYTPHPQPLSPLGRGEQDTRNRAPRGRVGPENACPPAARLLCMTTGESRGGPARHVAGRPLAALPVRRAVAMHRLLGCALLGLAVCAAGLGAQGDKGTKDGKKGTRAGNEVVGKVKAVDLEKKAFTITPEAGKDRTFLVDDKT